MTANTAVSGRPRDGSVDAAILAAARKCLGRDGYTRMTVDAVASEAGVTRPTIYRRWPTKAALIVAAISDIVSKDEFRVTGDVREDLVDTMAAVYRALIEQERIQLLGSIFAEDHHNPEFVILIREHVIDPRRGQFEEILKSGVALHRIQSDVDIAMVTDFLIGSFLSCWMSGRTVPSDWPERSVSLIWPSISRDARQV